jgi:aldose 1-epimerase
MSGFELTAAGLIDELFLTLSPLLAGRSAADQRLSLVEGTALLPSSPVGCRAADATGGGLHLFLRYELPRPARMPVIAEAGQDALTPSGRQVEIASAEQRTLVVEVGGELRAYSADARELLDGYAADEMCSSARGQCLVPWSNRIRDGRYEFAGSLQQLPLTEPERQCAIHGLARWANWTIAVHAADAVTMAHLLYPQPGYPHTLRLAVEYRLDSDGLTMRSTATNVGATACPYGAGAHPYLTVGTPSVDSVVLQDAAFTDLERDDDGRARVHFASLEGDVATTFWLDESYRYLMLFTGDPLPDVNRRSLGIEPMTCAPNAFQSGDGLVTLEHGESFAVCWGIEPS